MKSENTKRNRTTQIVYWMLGAIAILGVLLMFWPRENAYTILRGDLKLSDDASEVVNDYLEWAERASVDSMSMSHNFTADGLTKMAKALMVLSKSASKKAGQNAEPEIDTIIKVANAIVKNPQSSVHAEQIKSAFLASQEVLTIVQVYSFPQLKNEIESFSQTVSTIDTNKQALEQKNEIANVYKQVAAILRMMTDENKNDK